MLKTKKWSGHWKASKRPVKQRRYSKNAPKHVVKKFMSVHLSKDLRKKYSTRNILVRKGDKIKVMRGEFAKKEGRVSRVNYKRRKVYAENIDLIKRAGAKAQVGLQPSNLMIIELNLDDKRRMKKFTSKEKK
ncbi:50S ribosomal protein L24 [Candidatus Woesearchaeota archaeon]|nr:50S ribosomal protein L24P [uncultured archaeon]MBS3166970.1 50S ribosomal protein L24 [Candidatus Woesearchaeota archaeon]